MNELIKQTVAAELVVADPFDASVTHNASDVDAIINSGLARVHRWRDQIAAAGGIENMSVAMLKDAKKSIEADNKALTGYAEKYANGVVDFVGLSDSVQKLRVQIKGAGRSVDPLSVRGKMEAIIREIDAAIDAQTPPAPMHTYVMRMTLTDAALDKLVKYAEKLGAMGLAYTAPQGDRQIKAFEKWLETNCNMDA